jgi:hypothetical protein
MSAGTMVVHNLAAAPHEAGTKRKAVMSCPCSQQEQQRRQHLQQGPQQLAIANPLPPKSKPLELKRARDEPVKQSSIYCGVSQNGDRWKATLGYRKGGGPDKNFTDHCGTFETEEMAADAYKKAWDEFAPPDKKYKYKRLKTAPRLKKAPRLKPAPKATEALQLTPSSGGELMPLAFMTTQAAVDLVATLSESAVASIEADPNTAIKTSPPLPSLKPLLLDESGTYDFKVTVQNITLLVDRGKLESASEVLFHLMQHSPTPGELILSDFPAPAIMAVMLPISVTGLCSFDFLADGDLVWQALMAACILEIKHCVTLFVGLLMSDQYRTLQALDSDERIKTARVLQHFNQLEGVSPCIQSLNSASDDFWICAQEVHSVDSST